MPAGAKWPLALGTTADRRAQAHDPISWWLAEGQTMIDSRMKIAAGLLTGVLSVLATAQAAHATSVTEVYYACDNAQRLIVRQSGDTASVYFIDRSYLLRRSRSGIGEKFLSPTAALIMDGKSAVFVAEDRLQLGRCLEASRTAWAGAQSL